MERDQEHVNRVEVDQNWPQANYIHIGKDIHFWQVIKRHDTHFKIDTMNSVLVFVIIIVIIASLILKDISSDSKNGNKITTARVLIIARIILYKK